jgi:hypothetical protein
MEATQRTPCSASIVHGHCATASLKAPLSSLLHTTLTNIFTSSSAYHFGIQNRTHLQIINSGHLRESKSIGNFVHCKRSASAIPAKSCMNSPCAPSSHLAYISTRSIAPTLQLSQMGANPLTSNDGWLDVDQSRKEHLKVSLSASYRHSGAVYSLPYNQVILHIIHSYLAASDGAFSGQTLPDRPDVPTLPVNVPDSSERPSVVQLATLSHGCQCLSYMSHKVIPYPTRTLSYEPPSLFLEPQPVSLIIIPAVHCQTLKVLPATVWSCFHLASFKSGRRVPL